MSNEQGLTESKKWGGKRLGAGRPAHAKNVRTLEKEKIKRNLDQRYLRASRVLANSQILIATGQTFLYKIEKEYVPAGKFGNKKEYWKNKKPVLVESQDEIEQYLDSLAERANGDMDDEFDPAATYFYMTTKEPSNEAIKDIMNRVHGMPKATIDSTVTHVFSLKDLASRREALKVASKVIDQPQQHELPG